MAKAKKIQMTNEKFAKLNKVQQKATLFAYFDNCCAACGCADIPHLNIEHNQPKASFANKNDPAINAWENLQIMCSCCNTQIKGEILGMPRLKPHAPIYDTRKLHATRMAFRLSCIEYKAKFGTTRKPK